MKQWTLRYKNKQLVRDGLIEAHDEATAEKVGQAYCDLEADRRFISVSNPILADETILKPEVKAEPTSWDALTAVERIAKTTGKPVDAVLEDLKKQHRAAPFQLREAEAAATAATKQ